MDICAGVDGGGAEPSLPQKGQTHALAESLWGKFDSSTRREEKLWNISAVFMKNVFVTWRFSVLGEIVAIKVPMSIMVQLEAYVVDNYC